MHYFNYLVLGIGSACLAFAVEAMAASSIAASNQINIDSSAPVGNQLLLAKSTPAKRGPTKRSGAREKNLIRERTFRGEQRKLDFDAVDIRGERTNPLGTQLGQTKANKEFDLIKIRLRWHPEMIQSTSSLETGRSR